MAGRLRNTLTVCKGLFMTDREASAKARVRQLLSRFTWELPNTLVGFLTSVATTLALKTEVRFFHGSTFIKVLRKDDKEGYNATTLGSFIIGTPHSDPLLHHEYGHCLQSRLLGPGYLPLVAIPSFISATLSKGSHDSRWFEKDADNRGKLYVNKGVLLKVR